LPRLNTTKRAKFHVTVAPESPFLTTADAGGYTINR
jgi:hypothetical protein